MVKGLCFSDLSDNDIHPIRDLVYLRKDRCENNGGHFAGSGKRCLECYSRVSFDEVLGGAILLSDARLALAATFYEGDFS